jgi:uncharacterized protein
LNPLRHWRSLVPVRLEWGPAKDALNRAKHGIAFDEAAAIFASKAPRLEIDNASHGGDEPRYRVVGMTIRGVLVVVCTDRDDATR